MTSGQGLAEMARRKTMRERRRLAAEHRDVTLPSDLKPRLSGNKTRRPITLPRLPIKIEEGNT